MNTYETNRITINHLKSEYTTELYYQILVNDILLQDPNLDRTTIQDFVKSYIENKTSKVEKPFSHGTEIKAWWSRFIAHVNTTENNLKKHKNWLTIASIDDDSSKSKKRKRDTDLQQANKTQRIDKQVNDDNYSGFSEASDLPQTFYVAPTAQANKMCYYKFNCWNSKCELNHPDGYKPGIHNKPCKFQDTCSNSNCIFKHVDGFVPGPHNKPCRFSDTCGNSKCIFKHVDGYKPGPHNKLCEFPDTCSNPNCIFKHVDGFVPGPHNKDCLYDKKCINTNCKLNHSLGVIPGPNNKICRKDKNCIKEGCPFKHSPHNLECQDDISTVYSSTS